ncbi:MAG: ribonuclease J [Firmicutes bacterium]|nr:ribonuclease J [Bacillota bacterium]
MLAIEYDGEILVIDAGLMLPEEEMLGIDCVIPDISFLLENKEKVKGIVLSHGHEGHIGALPYILGDLSVPVYGTPLTLGLVGDKLLEAGYGRRESKLRKVRLGHKARIGSFGVEFIRVNHSIPDAAALGIYTDLGTIIYTGDFKFDQTPADGQITDFNRLSELGNEGVLLLLSESTKAEKTGCSGSELDVEKTLERIFSQAEGRLIVAISAFNLNRVQQILKLAKNQDRKVVLVGQDLITAVRAASRLQYFQVPEEPMVNWDDIEGLPREKQVVLASGSRGNPFSILAPSALGGERKFRVLPGDTVVIASGAGNLNGRMTTRIIDHLFLEGAQVVYQGTSGIGASSHAAQEELKMMINLVRPRFFVPMHGEYRQLVQHAKLAKAVGIPGDGIFLLENGNILELSANGARVTGKVTAGKVLVDGLGVGDVGKVVLRDRRHLSQDGILIVVITMAKEKGEVVAGPDLISRGFVYVRESEDLLKEARDKVREVLDKCGEDRIYEWSTIKSMVRQSLGRFLFDKTRRRPMILPIIVEI